MKAKFEHKKDFPKQMDALFDLKKNFVTIKRTRTIIFYYKKDNKFFYNFCLMNVGMGWQLMMINGSSPMGTGEMGPKLVFANH